MMSPRRKLAKWTIGAASAAALVGVGQLTTDHGRSSIGIDYGMLVLFAPVCLLQLALVAHGARSAFGRGHAIVTLLSSLWGACVAAFFAAVTQVHDDWASQTQTARWPYGASVVAGGVVVLASVVAVVFPEPAISRVQVEAAS